MSVVFSSISVMEIFNNEAARELHISALLIVLAIPYTGMLKMILEACSERTIYAGHQVAAQSAQPEPLVAVI